MSKAFVDIFGNVVAATSVIVTPKLQLINPDIVGVNYLYGPPLEIIKILTQWTASDTFEPKKYPLVALFQPFDEQNGPIGFASINDIRFIIAGLTTTDGYTSDRYANMIKPILYPIYDELMNQLYYNSNVDSVKGQIAHTKRDWPFWDDGKQANPFNDKLDVLEIINMKLNIILKTC